MTQLQLTDVLFINPADSDFVSFVESEVAVINGELAMDFDDGDSWLFRTVTGEREGLPVVDLDKCRRVEIETKASLIELPELMALPFAQALKQLAR